MRSGKLVERRILEIGLHRRLHRHHKVSDSWVLVGSRFLRHRRAVQRDKEMRLCLQQGRPRKAQEYTRGHELDTQRHADGPLQRLPDREARPAVGVPVGHDGPAVRVHDRQDRPTADVQADDRHERAAVPRTDAPALRDADGADKGALLAAGGPPARELCLAEEAADRPTVAADPEDTGELQRPGDEGPRIQSAAG